MAVDFDFTIIGGGVIGLACARALAKHGSVLLVEQHSIYGSETSSRNSEVIHAGLYYPSGSLKETLCLRGRKQLYTYCEEQDIPHRRIGKLIVAPSLDHPKLAQLEQKAHALNIPISRLTATELREREPQVNAAEALLSPETGIIDSHVYMLRLSQDAERRGGLLMKHTGFKRAASITSHANNHWHVTLTTTDGEYTVNSKALINAAGLHSHDVAQACGHPLGTLPPLHLCRGHYFSYSGQRPFNHLIYPLPEENLAGLGIHATLDLGGQVRFGPDTQYLKSKVSLADNDIYTVSPSLKETFTSAIQSYFPNLQPSLLSPGYAGIRPKLSHANENAADFTFVNPRPLHEPPLLHLLGIDSPGLSASLAIADEVVYRLTDNLSAL
jgi:L-2-hydroxyglutarate oxidase LhgO